MKKTIVAIFVIGLMAAACQNPAGGGGGSVGTGTVTGDTYANGVYTLENAAVLIVGRTKAEASKAVITVTPKTGCYFILKHGNEIISEGNITGTGTLTFRGSNSITFTATVSGTGSSSTLTIKREITYTVNGATQTIPANSTGTSAGTPTILEGAWVFTSNSFSSLSSGAIVIFSGNTIYREIQGTSSVDCVKGNFSLKSTSIMCIQTHYLDDSTGKWVEAASVQIEQTYSLNGDTFTLRSADGAWWTYTKMTSGIIPTIPN